MAVHKMRVFFTDGRKVEVAVSPKAQVIAERLSKTGRLPDALETVEGTFTLAYVALRTAGHDVPADFDVFLDEVVDVEDADQDKKKKGEFPAEDPTNTAQSRGDSSD